MSAGEVTRPSGKVYRRRKPPATIVVEWGYEEDTVVIVERTHDVEEARPLALAAWRRDAYPVDEFPDDAHVGWLKLVPWDAIGSGCDSTYLETDGDDPRAYPYVRFGPGE